MSVLIPSATPVIGSVLGVSAVGVWLSGRRDFLLRWLSFFAITPILLLAAATGRHGATALAIIIGVVCACEYARMVRLDRWTRLALLGGVLITIGYSYQHRDVDNRLVLLLGVVVPLLGARGDQGLRQSALVSWGVLWLGCSVAVLLDLGSALVPLAIAVSVGDVAAYFGGSFARRYGDRWRPLSVRLNGLSPNKTWAGLITGGIIAICTVAVLGAFTPGRAVAVTAGAVVGDLIESMVKRGSGVKDAGAWLPGFGGLLDRVDSLLGALLVLAVLS
ncbi:MAG TPA: phosphatidate cytidylyltransferase [Jatrophihabitantaceae bacterium]|nr:phosphatidate cytidylyltransferase [Jatrophihabitantaceae bacterium]